MEEKIQNFQKQQRLPGRPKKQKISPSPSQSPLTPLPSSQLSSPSNSLVQTKSEFDGSFDEFGIFRVSGLAYIFIIIIVAKISSKDN